MAWTNIKAKSPVQFLILLVSDYLLPAVYSISFQRLTIGGKTGDSSDFWGMIVSSGSFYCQHVTAPFKWWIFFALIIVRCRSLGGLKLNLKLEGSPWPLGLQNRSVFGGTSLPFDSQLVISDLLIEFVFRNPWHIWQKQVKFECVVII